MSKKVLKSLSGDMEEELMSIHERELLFIEPAPGYLNRAGVALFNRGLVSLKHYTIGTKKFYAFKITPLGIFYLSDM